MTDKRLYSDNLVDITIGEVVAIITTAAKGLAPTNRQTADAMYGVARALMRKTNDIKKNILEKLEP